MSTHSATGRAASKAVIRSAPIAIVELDRRAQARLHHRYRSLVGRIGKNKTVIAVARELAGFVWAAGQHVTPTAA